MKKTVYLCCVVMLALFASGSHAQILSENFRNMDCLNCKVPDQQYDLYMKNHPSYKIIIVNYHSSSPWNKDPFYLQSKTDVDYRNNTFYGIIGNPYMFVNGYNAGNNESNWETFTEDAASSTLPVTVSVVVSMQGSSLKINAHTEGGTNGNEVRPYALIVESDIEYVNSKSYGNPDNNLWNNIVRAIAPTSNGGDPITLSGSHDFEYLVDTTGRNWNVQNVHVVFFVQETGNPHKIDGVGTMPLAGVKQSAEFSGYSLGIPSPNPLSQSSVIPFSLKDPAQVKLVVTDMLGNDLKTIFNGFVTSSLSSADLTTNTLPDGMYFVRMFVNGSLVDMEKIVVQK